MSSVYGLIPALLVPFCGALTFIAYRHPKTYAVLRPGFSRAMTMVSFIVAAYLIGFTRGRGNAYGLLLPFTDGMQGLKGASAAYDAADISTIDGMLWIGIPGFLALYVVVVEEVCKLLNEEKKLDRENQKEDDDGVRED